MSPTTEEQTGRPYNVN